jgi:hypothetical protein
MSKQSAPRLTITVAADGTTRSDFLSFSGNECMEAGRRLHTLLAELGVKTEITTFTPKPELTATTEHILLEQQKTQEGGSEWSR